jgi:hypothetical protein
MPRLALSATIAARASELGDPTPASASGQRFALPGLGNPPHKGEGSQFVIIQIANAARSVLQFSIDKIAAKAQKEYMFCL